MFLGDGLLEWIQVHHHHVDHGNAVLFKCADVFREVAPCQNAAVHLGVQRLDAAIEHFREAGVIRHLGHVDAIVGQQLGGAAGGENIDSHATQGAGKVEHAGFVGYRDKSLFNHDKVRSDNQSIPCCCNFLRSVLRFIPSMSAACD